MGLFGRAGDQVSRAVGMVGALRSIAKELRLARETQQVLIDSIREASGLALIYAERVAEPEPQSLVDRAELIVPPEDHQAMYMLELLAKEAKISLDDPNLDLVQEGLSRGWIDEGGNFLIIPEGADR